ncbi:hypothetical protein [Flavisphingomonas formosensis]|nr:hypothetical protein [Sphingomonas formosensis]
MENELVVEPVNLRPFLDDRHLTETDPEDCRQTETLAHKEKAA